MCNAGLLAGAVTNCTFSGNSAGASAAGCTTKYSSPAVTNCTFTGNSASTYGGGRDVQLVSCSPTVTNCTFAGTRGPVTVAGCTTTVPRRR